MHPYCNHGLHKEKMSNLKVSYGIHNVAVEMLELDAGGRKIVVVESLLMREYSLAESKSADIFGIES